jgi:hypothetical protein
MANKRDDLNRDDLGLDQDYEPEVGDKTKRKGGIADRSPDLDDTTGRTPTDTGMEDDVGNLEDDFDTDRF